MKVILGTRHAHVN